MEFRTLQVGPKKPGGKRNLRYKMFFFGPFTWDTTTPIYDEDVRGPIWQHWDLKKKMDEALEILFGSFFAAFFCSMLGGKLPGAVLDVFFSDLQMFVFIFRR